MSSRLIRPITAFGGALLIASLLSGCGGSGSAGNSAVVTRKGQVQLRIVWPAKSRATGKYIPAYASSLFFELSPKGNPATIYTLVVNRPSGNPSTQDVTFSQLLASGTYELAGAARALADAQGATVASGAVEVNVQPGINAVPLTLNSTVKTLQVLGQPITVGVGQNLTLQSGAFDPDGNGLLLPDGALTWSVVAGSQFGSITPAGVLTATAAGTMTVRVSEPVTGVKADATVTITVQASNTGLADSGYPKAGGDTGNSSQVTGSGATGQIAWSFDLKHRGVNTPVLGNNNMIFALQQKGIVYALDATSGDLKWQATLPNLLGDISSGSLVVGSDNTLYVGYDYGLQAYDAGTGLPKWTNADFAATGSINLAAGRVYIPARDLGVGVVDARTGATVTMYPGLSVAYDVAINNGIAYYVTEQVGGGSRSASLYAINTTTGAAAWSKSLNILPSSGYNGGNPTVGMDGTVYIGLSDGSMNAFDGMTGAPKGSIAAGGNTSSARPIIASDGSVYFQLRDTGNVLKTVHYDAGLTQRLGSSTTLLKQMSIGSDGTLYGGGVDSDNPDQSAVYALNTSDGSVKWKAPLTAGVEASPPQFGQVSGYAAVGKTGMVYVVSIDQRLYAIK